MDDPIQDVGRVVHTLTQGTPSEQKAALEIYYTEDASFIHPFCRVNSFPGSRGRILAILRWYKIMSPRIELEIESIAYDELKQILYLTITQDFSIWFLFGLHNAVVTLTTKLQLEKKDKKYYIQSQNDLYQVDQFLKFVSIPRGMAGYLWMGWQWIASIMCIVLAHAFWFITAAEQWYADQGKQELQHIRSKTLSELGAEAKDKVVSESKRVTQSLQAKTNTQVNGSATR